ncbi:MAG: hypothetical protein ACFE85_06890 [Candidatus Hodarchaeota archaeon]
MTEILKLTKYSLLLYTLGGLVFAILYLFVTDIYLYDLTAWPFVDPYYPRAFGGTLLILAIFSLLMYFKKEWEHIKLVYELALLWLIMVLVLNILELALLISALPILAITNTIINTIIVVVFLAIGLYCYMKQRG